MNGMDISVFEGDITSLEVDALANAANSSLWMGSGVAGAIKQAGGRRSSARRSRKRRSSPATRSRPRAGGCGRAG